MRFAAAVLGVSVWGFLLLVAFSIDVRVGLLIGGLAALAWTIERKGL